VKRSERHKVETAERTEQPNRRRKVEQREKQTNSIYKLCEKEEGGDKEKNKAEGKR
jgi:hypothetical protein